eukprot:PhM_4_TR16667/c0_g1_i1/m.106181
MTSQPSNSNTGRVAVAIVVVVAFLIMLPYIIPSSGSGSSSGSTEQRAAAGHALAAANTACSEAKQSLAQLTETMKALAKAAESAAANSDVSKNLGDVQAAATQVMGDRVKSDATPVAPAQSSASKQSRFENAWKGTDEVACRALDQIRALGCPDCTNDFCQFQDLGGKPPCSRMLDTYHEMLIYPTDINRLVPIIHSYAMRASHVVEMGSRRGHSTTGILQAYPMNFTVIDLIITEDVRAITDTYRNCKPTDRIINVVESDDLLVDISPETEMLFIDTWHAGQLLRKELAKHASKSRRWLLFHDVISFGHGDEGGGGQGLWPVIRDFVKEHSDEWEEEAYFPFSHGLLVLRRKNQPDGGKVRFADLYDKKELAERVPWAPR